MDEFDNLFGLINLKQVVEILTGNIDKSINLTEVYETSMQVIKYDTNDIDLIKNHAFLKAWGIARAKSIENLKLMSALLILKKKYNVKDFDFQLLLENFDEENML